MHKWAPPWWGNRRHRLWSVALFVILASLDNVAGGVLPPLFPLLRTQLQVDERALGLLVSMTSVVYVLATLVGGYLGGRVASKPLLLGGTLMWSIALACSGTVSTFVPFLLWQLVAVVGYGCVGAVGFGVVSDFVPAHRRGVVLSVWGLTQAGGALDGALLSGLVGVYNWRLPFWIVAGAGVISTLLYLLAYAPPRGQADLEAAAGRPVDNIGSVHIRLADVPFLLHKPTNRWLLLYSTLASLATGSAIWTSLLFVAKMQVEGYSQATATVVATFFSAVLGSAGFFSIVGGWLGDRWQRRNPRARVVLGTVGILGALPCNIVLFFLPLHGLHLPADLSLVPLGWALLTNLWTNGWVLATFVLAFSATLFGAVAAPNLAALMSDVNLPEHRSTVFGLQTVVAGIGGAVSGGLATIFFHAVLGTIAPPLNYAVGLAAFQLFVLPATWCFWQVATTTARDLDELRYQLLQRTKGQ